jgi:hypothetical protein
MSEKKFNFIPASQFSEKGGYRYEVTLSKNQALFFSRETIETYDLSPGIFKFYLDPDNNTLGWKVIRGGKLDILKRRRGTGTKQLNISKANGTGTVEVSLELRKMKLDLSKIKTKKHIVHSYKIPDLLLEDGGDIDYIELDEYAK